MDVQFQIMQSIVLQRAKEGILSLNSNGTQGTTAGRLREHASLTTALKQGTMCSLRLGTRSDGSSEGATSNFLLKK